MAQSAGILVLDAAASQLTSRKSSGVARSRFRRGALRARRMRRQVLPGPGDGAAHSVARASGSLRVDAQLNAAIVQERARLARDLHDAVIPLVFSAGMIADCLPYVLQKEPEEAILRAREVASLARAAQAELRALLLDLRSETLLDTDLGDLLADLVKEFVGRSAVNAVLRTTGTCGAPSPVQVSFYRIAREALANAERHARAQRVVVTLDARPESLALTVEDNGRGFDSALRPALHFGLFSIREQAAAIGASLEITSTIGTGTTIAVTWRETPGEVTTYGQ